MKFKKASSMLSCAVLAAISGAAMADDTGWYVGGNIGQANLDVDQVRLADELTPGFTNTFSDKDDKDFAFKLFGGYQYNRYLSIEFGYFNLGQHSFRTATNPLGTLTDDMRINGINVDLVGYLPLSDNFSLFGRVGANHAKVTNYYWTTNSAVASDDFSRSRATYPKVGLGLQYAVNDDIKVRAEVERYRFDNGVGQVSDANLFTVGVVYHFGSAPAPAPVVVTPPPAPAPAPVVEPPAPRFEKYTLSATELFAFDSATVSMPQPKLDEIANAIKGPGAPQQVVITGYTDRLGSDSYNQKLSERRAQAVKDYMVGRGIPAERLVVEGKGEADPVVQCAEKNQAALIKCLAPNRRVEIDEVKIVREVKSN